MLDLQKEDNKIIKIPTSKRNVCVFQLSSTLEIITVTSVAQAAPDNVRPSAVRADNQVAAQIKDQTSVQPSKCPERDKPGAVFTPHYPGLLVLRSPQPGQGTHDLGTA